LLAKIPPTNLHKDQISPEGARLTNWTAARPEGSLDRNHYNLTNFSNFNKSLVYFMLEAEENILKAQTPIFIKNSSSRSRGKQYLRENFGPMMQGDQLLKIFTALIDIPSIMIGHLQEADKTIKLERNF
jgi:hypothetical protein